MAVEASQPLKISVPAGADLSALQYTVVKRNASGQAVAVTAATDVAIGVLQNKPKAAGQMAEVVVCGVTKLVSSGTIAVGAQVAFTSSGQAVTAAATGYGGAFVQGTKQIIGVLYGTAAAAINDVCTVVVEALNPSPGT